LQQYGRSGAVPSPAFEQDGGGLPSAPKDDEDDVRLVGALVTGEEQARAALFDRYGAHIQTVLAHLVGYGEAERADLLHDVFIRAFERIADLKNPRSLKHWLTRIAVLTTHEWFRRRKRIAQQEPLENAENRPAAPLQPEAREAIRAFYSLMARFDADERSAFILRFVEGMNLQEVADVCDVSLSTARRRIRRADVLFRRILPEYPALLEHLTESTT
jgi:RNA polymerase sigma-70 factor (ECF subfamily)